MEPVLTAFIKQAALEEVFHLIFHPAVCKKELAPNQLSMGEASQPKKGCKGWKSVLPRGENRTGSLLIHCNSSESSKQMTALTYTHLMLFQKLITKFQQQTKFSGPSTIVSSISLCFLHISSPLLLSLKPLPFPNPSCSLLSG